MDMIQKVAPILEHVGEKLRAGFGKGEVLRNKTGNPWDLVTECDEYAESYLAEHLCKIDPSIAFYGEEFGGDTNQERFWLVDPIDGTAHFVRGVPWCSTMLALVEQGQVVFSVIYDFTRQDFYWAEHGAGAWKNKERIHVSSRSLSGGYLFAEINIKKPENLESFLRLDDKTVIVDTVNCGFEFAMVASGKFDGRVTVDPWGKLWDFAPGTFLVREAGGMVTNIGKSSYDYRNFNFIAANPVIHEELTQGAEAIFSTP